MSEESGAGKRGWLGRRRESAPGSSWRRRAKPLREAAGKLLDSALDEVEARLRTRARSGDARPGDRLREVMERDRAVATAHASLIRASAVDVAMPPRGSFGGDEDPADAPDETEVEERAPSRSSTSEVGVCKEPIRTRTYANVLAAQGDFARALGVVLHLLTENPGDPELEAEARRLREALARD